MNFTEIKKDLPDIPIIIMGHSMGSIIARKYISNYERVPKMAIFSGTLPPISMKKAWVPLFLNAVVGLFMKDKRTPFIAKLFNNPLSWILLFYIYQYRVCPHEIF